jgi:hypothetical protein
MATEKTVDELRLENNILLEICESAKKETQANNRDPESIGLLPSPDRNVLEFNCNDQTPLNRKRTIDFISDTESVDSFHTAKRSFIRDQTTGHEKENLSNFKPENDIVFEPKDLCGILRRSLSTSDLDVIFVYFLILTSRLSF